MAEAVNFLISGEVDVTKFKDEAKGCRYDVRGDSTPQDRVNPDDFEDYAGQKDGRLVQVSNVASFQEAGGSAHQQQSR